MQSKECTYNQAARTLVGLGLCNVPLAESDTGFSFLWLIVLGTADALEVPPVHTHIHKKRGKNAYAQYNRKLHAILVLQHLLP